MISAGNTPTTSDVEVELENAGLKIEKKKKCTWFGRDGKGKLRPGPRMRAGVLEVLAKMQSGFRPEYKLTAENHGLNPGSLRQMVTFYKKGKLELGDPIGRENVKAIDLRAELERSLNLIARYERHLNDVLEELMKKAVSENKQGNHLAFDQLGIPKVRAELSAVVTLRKLKEKGALEILEKLMEIDRARRGVPPPQEEKQLNGQTITVPTQPQSAATLIHAERERDIHEILGSDDDGGT